MNLTIVVPSYNEEEALNELIPALVEICSEKKWKAVIVNDGSKDGSRRMLDSFQEESCLTIIHHKINRGYGGAIKTGIINTQTEYVITIDADGQHYLEDIEKLVGALRSTEADLVVGSRKNLKDASWLRSLGKKIIRRLAKIFMTFDIYDINSGMKLYRTNLAKRFIPLCPDTMAFSEIMTFLFIFNKHLVVEESIRIKERMLGKSTITYSTALQTFYEILNIVILFNPIKIFLPLSIFFILSGLFWGIPIVLAGRGVSVGSLLAIISGIIFFMIGLIAEQLSKIRRNIIGDSSSPN
jgi:glycosyltransferase involved in cell wall biosynthesis